LSDPKGGVFGGKRLDQKGFSETVLVLRGAEEGKEKSRAGPQRN